MIAGVDFDSFGVYVACLPWEEADDELGARFHILGFRERRREVEAEWAFEAAKRIPDAIAAIVRPSPTVVYVEKPFVPRGQIKQAVGLGRVQGLIVAGFARAGVEVIEEMTPGEWRRGVGALGNAPKANAHALLAELYPVPLPRDENLRDALAIAWTARKLNATGR